MIMVGLVLIFLNFVNNFYYITLFSTEKKWQMNNKYFPNTIIWLNSAFFCFKSNLTERKIYLFK